MIPNWAQRSLVTGKIVWDALIQTLLRKQGPQNLEVLMYHRQYGTFEARPSLAGYLPRNIGTNADTPSLSAIDVTCNLITNELSWRLCGP